MQQSDATRFLILEFVEGETLADILKKRGALPVDEALGIAKQICEALEAAHEKGIIHRDLKPANVTAYMSPEQAKGRTVDRRTDIFAFGCVLYEMLTGRAAFDGDDVGEILARVIEREPDWSIAAGLRTMIPSATAMPKTCRRPQRK